jgi:hypothetical protein
MRFEAQYFVVQITVGHADMLPDLRHQPGRLPLSEMPRRLHTINSAEPRAGAPPRDLPSVARAGRRAVSNLPSHPIAHRAQPCAVLVPQYA